MLDREYDPKDIEEKWYDVWLDRKYFHARDEDGSRPGYAIVIPPPNVTGVLHMGHALNNTLQDIMIRYKRMDGYNTLWMPGTDHAGIATQNVVEKSLAERGTSRHDLGREAFIEEVWRWREKHGGLIINQLKRLGASCDWDRTRFTMDEGLSNAVRKVFVTLYNDGLIYRSDYIVNWCPRCHSALSDLEVEHEEEDGHLWHIRYPMADGSGEVVVATTRPETMLGDTAVAVNPADERYKAMLGRELVLPVMNRRIPVIADDVVDREFGTGAVKITPAHDLNDYEMSLRHGLEVIVVIDESGNMNANAGIYNGLDRFACRRQLEADLQEQGYLVDKTAYRVPVGTCYRCKTTIEPYLSKQWFVKTRPLADEAIKAVAEGRTRIIPKNWEKVYYEWMNNIRDWCISRQIWWGHRIPAWYCDDCGEVIVSESDPGQCTACRGSSVRQETDVLDTWFSSGLWPFSTLGWPDQTSDLESFYPTSLLSTAFDIIFFWVARMIVMGMEFIGDIPFSDVYIHQLVRDKKGRKMSKSLGNGIDPIEVIQAYGADATRFSLAILASQGSDIRYDVKSVETYQHFANKLWNASRFALMNLDPSNGGASLAIHPDQCTLADGWILSSLNDTIRKTTDFLSRYEYNFAAKSIYEFFWNQFCDWYLESAKPILYGDSGPKQNTRAVLAYVLDQSVRILHPFMPFITEEIWQHLPVPKEAPSLIIAPWPEERPEYAFVEKRSRYEALIEEIRGIRNLRAQFQVPPSRKLTVAFRFLGESGTALLEEELAYIRFLANVEEVAVVDRKPEKSATAFVDSSREIYVILGETIDWEGERQRLEKEIDKTRVDLQHALSKLNNPKFMAHAEAEAVEEAQLKAEEAKKTLQRLELLLKDFFTA